LLTRLTFSRKGGNRHVFRSLWAPRRLPAVAKKPAGGMFNLALLKRRGTSRRAAKSRNCRNEQESAWRFAIRVLRGKLRYAPQRFYFRTDAAPFAWRDDFRFISTVDDRHLSSRRLTFPLCIVTTTGLRCSSKAALRLRRAQDTACRKLPNCNNLFLDVRVLSHKLTPTSQTLCGEDQ
jgi:hypothetical protein